MYGNQFKSTGVSKNLNVRIAPDLRERMESASKRYSKSQADIVRAALELYLPILEGSIVDNANAGETT